MATPRSCRQSRGFYATWFATERTAPFILVESDVHLGGWSASGEMESSRTGKPRRASGASIRQRIGGTTDSPADQGLEVTRLKDANGKGARNHGDVGAAAGGGKCSEGSDTEGTKRKHRRHARPPSATR